jgi:hypothetical protein
MQLGTERGRRIPSLQQSFRYIFTELRITAPLSIVVNPPAHVQPEYITENPLYLNQAVC